MMKQLGITCTAVLFFLLGCAGSKDPGATKSISIPGIDIDTYSVLARLERTNARLSSFKGIGRIKIWNTDGLQSTRVVWAGYQTEKLRLEILGVGGRPFSSIVYDGSRLYLSLHAQNRFFQKRTRQADLSSLISLPVTVKDVLTILAGRVPLLKHATPSLERDPGQNQYILILKKGWLKKRTGKIYLRQDMNTVWKYELYQGTDTLLYRVEFLRLKPYGDYRLPDTLLFSDDLQTKIRIDVDDIWPDAKLPPSVFILEPPG